MESSLERLERRMSALAAGSLYVPVHALQLYQEEEDYFSVDPVTMTVESWQLIVAFSDMGQLRRALPGFGHVVPQPEAWVEMLKPDLGVSIDPGVDDASWTIVTGWNALTTFLAQPAAIEKLLLHEFAVTDTGSPVGRGLSAWATARPDQAAGLLTAVAQVDEKEVGLLVVVPPGQGTGKFEHLSADTADASGLPSLVLAVEPSGLSTVIQQSLTPVRPSPE